MTGENSQLPTMLGADTDGGKAVTYPGSFGYGPGDLYGMGTFSLPGMGLQASPFQNGIIMGATGFTTGAVITSNGKNMACEITSAQPANIKKENKVSGFFNPLKKSWSSFKEIGTDIKTGAKTRGDKAFDSPYDFVNWVTIGASHGIYTGAVDRTSKKNDSFYDFTNYWTVGLSDLVKGATAPEEQFSKEHWLSSFGLATSVIGGVKAVTPTKPISGISKGLAKPKETIKSAEENSHKRKGNSIEHAESGGRNISPEQFFKEELIAEEMYQKFRGSGVEDVNAIAKNTGFSVPRVQRIKNHIFTKEHIKDYGVGRFDPDYELAQAWQRLIDGKHVDSDIQLLYHETFESKFEGIFQTNYRTAHDKTIESGRPWNWEKK